MASHSESVTNAAHDWAAAVPYSNTAAAPHAAAASPQRRNGRHVNYAWRSLDRIKYPCLAEVARPGTTITVALHPGDSPAALPPPTLGVSPGMLLITRGALRGLDDPNFAVKQCPAFWLHDVCAAGSDCAFAHVVHIDPKARLFARARDGVRRSRGCRGGRSKNSKTTPPQPSGGGTVAMPTPSTQSADTSGLLEDDETPRPPGGTDATTHAAAPPLWWYRNPYSVDAHLVYVSSTDAA